MAEDQAPFRVRKVNCPPGIFGEGAYVERRRFIKTRQIQELEAVIQSGDLAKIGEALAGYVWRWQIEDCETGEQLPQPYQNPDAFGELDYTEQLSWIMTKVFFEPKNF